MSGKDGDGNAPGEAAEGARLAEGGAGDGGRGGGEEDAVRGC